MEIINPGEIGRRVRQGCLLSPLIFSYDAEMMIKIWKTWKKNRKRAVKGCQVY